jgi:hypothetical protein
MTSFSSFLLFFGLLLFDCGPFFAIVTSPLGFVCLPFPRAAAAAAAAAVDDEKITSMFGRDWTGHTFIGKVG